MSKILKFIITTLFVISFLTSCERKIGSGVLLWSSDENLVKSGVVVNIYEESRIKHTYTFAEPGSKEKYEMDTWRINFFNKIKEAEEFSERYAPYVTSFAYTERQGLPIRAAETTSSERVYKLRAGQVVKVFGRSDDAVEVGNLGMGYWYHVLTEDGVSGYVFDAVLTVYSLNDTGKVIENAKDTSDPLLDNFLDSTWRPSYYSDMITKEIIDLATFKDSFFLRIDKEKKEISVRMYDKNVTENYTDIIQFGSKRYDFEGTSFRVTLVSDRVASVLYKFEGKDVNESFVRLDENVNEIVSAELEKRKKMLTEFIDRGSVFKSANYGSVNIIDGTGRFIWNDIQRLIDENIISPGSEPMGNISFNHFPDSLIKNIYSGVITFSFRNGSEINFLYSFTETGVSFVYVHNRYIKNKIVTTDQFFDPIQIYFKFDPSTGSGSGEGA
ncbi:MAG: SH3 domain-containing protein [Spirochaetaceae bacterium]|jgi:hypothetical protein|nr:SH3 domain-containing protein [Spirochaetaceae bacterium]